MWYQKSAEDVLLELQTTLETGLTQSEVENRLQQYGPNELPEPKKESLVLRFIKQFTDLLILTLIAATLISFLLGEYLDAIVILVIVIINGLLGFIQEYRAEKSLEALKKMAASHAVVIRDGKKQQIKVDNLVPGDIVVLTPGDKIAADGRVVETFNMATSEAVLTGESLPVDKSTEALLDEHLALGDQKNMVFKDTIVSRGQAKIIVTATGAKTEIGKISEMLATQEESATPLQEELNRVGKRLSLAAGIIVVIVFLVGLIVHTTSVVEMFLTSVALAVAAIPEGLPAVVTIVLSLGVTRMAAKKAIVKKLPAVETLGATAFICSDKTGTLTQNRIRVAQLITKNYVGDPQSLQTAKEIPSEVRQLLRCGVLNSDASITPQENGQSFVEVGDQTEVALLVVAYELGTKIDEERKLYPLLYAEPFDSDKKYMVTVHQTPNKQVLVYIKGAPEMVLASSQEMPDEMSFWQKKMEEMAQEGLRTLGFGFKQIPQNEWEAIQKDSKKIVKDIEFIGLVGERDPLRPEVIGAIQLAKEAGIETVMITGDHHLTALSIAKELGLATEVDQTLTGSDLAQMDDETLSKKLETVRVFARVSPDQKLRLVQLIQKTYGVKVAVTGDGVNDAPAIKAGDIGVAMGIEGTDVTREVADLVLEDDNYATIVSAVEEGRTIFANLVKFIRYLISCNISEIFIVFFAILLGYPAPLLPIQLLWVNLVTDGLPALALGMDPAESGVMKQPPRDMKEGILTKKRWLQMASEGLVIGLGALGAFIFVDGLYGDDVARTVAFTTLSLSQLVHALNNRSEYVSLFTLGVTSNKKLLATIVGSATLQMLVIYTPVGNLLFKATPLPLNLLMLCTLVAFVPFVFVEVRKQIQKLHGSKLVVMAS